MNAEDKILQKLTEHDARFDKVESTQEVIIQKLMEHDVRLEETVTKKDFNEFKERFFNDRDEMLTILRRLDQERIFTNEWIRRVEEDLKITSQEIAKVKLQLKIA